MKLHQLFNVILSTFFALMVFVATPTAAAADNPQEITAPQEKIDINSADADTLAAVMDGIGVVKAREIVAYRQQIGKFQTVDQLMEVRGIGLATIEKNRHLIMVVTE